MPNALQNAGALSEPSNFAPLHTNRIFTGLWTNRNLLRDAASSDYQEHIGMSRQDSILGGFNSEISSKLTLRRRPGSSVYNGSAIPPVKRFYSFNTFTLTDEFIRVMADTASTVYDVTGGVATAVFQKSPGAKSTYFLSIGNTLYMTNGVDKVQWVYDPTTGTGTIYPFGIDDPTQAPIASIPAWAGYGQWPALTVVQRIGTYGGVFLIDPNNNVQHAAQYGKSGTASGLTWSTVVGGSTPDGTVVWHMQGNGTWIASHDYGFGVVTTLYQVAPDGKTYFFQSQGSGPTGATPPIWPSGLNATVPDGSITWQNIGRVLYRADIGDLTVVGIPNATILDANGGVQQCLQAGKTGTTAPNFVDIKQALTSDPTGNPQGAVIWQNTGAIGPVQYGYAGMNSKTQDISNMSPASNVIVSADGETVNVTGQGFPAATGVDTIILFRTVHGGSTFLYDDQIPNPPPGNRWTYIDPPAPDSELNTEWQAQVGGEGTPLPSGATCLGYHLTRIFAAVGNVVWVSSGPDATVGGSSGNAGFDTQLVLQSKIIRFWACSLGMVVFTVRDAYIILGSATDADPLYMVVFIENLPLRNYDCFTVNKTTPYLLLGNNQLVALDPSAGIIEAGFPIADRLEEEYDASASYVTFHSKSSRDTALYVANGGMAPNPIDGQPPVPATGQWYRMSQNNAPEQGSAWSTKATLAGLNAGCVQSVEVTPGVYQLLISGTTAGPIWQRDLTKNTDNGNKYAVQTTFGNIVLAMPGQLAALFFITLESVKTGTRAGLALLLGEISGAFETLNRTRQDPPILPPSNTLFSDRYHFAQNQKEAWCRHFQMQVTWPAEDAANELLTFTIFGQTWQEMRSQ